MFSYRMRRFLSVVIVVVIMPAYVVLVISAMSYFDSLPIWVEALIYTALGIVWVFPFKRIFRGVGQANPDVPVPTAPAPAPAPAPAQHANKQ